MAVRGSDSFIDFVQTIRIRRRDTVRKYGVMGGLLLLCVLLLGMPNSGSAALFGKPGYSDIEDAMRAADHARDKYHYEREWYDSENKLEETRINRTSAKIPQHSRRARH